MKLIGQGEFIFENNTSFELMSCKHQVQFLKKKYSIKIEATNSASIIVKIEISVPSDTLLAYVSVFAVKRPDSTMQRTIEVIRENVSFTRHPNAPIDSTHTITFSKSSIDLFTEEILIFSSPICETSKVKALVFIR